MRDTYLERHAREARCGGGGACDGAPAGDAPGERHKVDAWVLHHVCREGGREVDDLNRSGWDACAREGGCEALGGEGRLRGGLEEDGVACDEGGEDGVDGDEVGEAVWGEDIQM